MTQKIKLLFPEQEQLIPIYKNKWKEFSLSTQSVSHEKSVEIITKAYNFIGQKEPNILLLDSPYQTLKMLLLQGKERLGIGLEKELQSQICIKLNRQIKKQLEENLGIYLWQQLGGQLDVELTEEVENPLWNYLEEQLENQLGNEQWEQLNEILWIERELKAETEYQPTSELTFNCFSSQSWVGDVSYCDFCISVLNCQHSFQEWEIFQSLVRYCGWVFPYENICIVSARPCFISFDNQQRLHNEGSPAIKFADGFSVYANHGKILT